MSASSERTHFPRGLLWAIAGLILLLALGFAGWRYTSRRLLKARAEQTPPLIFVREPVQGERFEPGDVVVVRATATGQRPLLRAELWVDGARVDVDESANEGGSEPLFASFRFRLPEGVHMLYVRAIDTAGVPGQSLGIGIEGRKGPERQPMIAIPYGPDSSLESLAADYELDAGLIIDANPWFTQDDRSPSGVVIVPAEAVEEPPEEDADADTPSIAPSGGQSPPSFAPGAPAGSIGDSGSSQALPWSPFPPRTAPSAPVDLQAQVQGCLVRLAWSSLSQADEFRIWMDHQSGSRELVAKVKPTNPPSERYQYEFEPRRAGMISLTVEAVNPIGAQTSAPLSVSLDRNCAPAQATGVRYETLGVETNPDFGKVYFYVSLEGRPEQRFPSDDSEFYALVSGHGQIQPQSSADQTLSLPPLQDGELDISGECWGWAGGELAMLAQFQERIPETEMLGQEIVLGDPNCRLSLALQPQDGSLSLSTFGGNASGLPAPYDLHAKQQKQYEALQGLLPNFSWLYRYTREVSWRWDGNPNDITGFTIYINGKATYKVADPKARKGVVVFPDKCGLPSTWSVVANGKAGDSPMSQQETLWQGPCTNYAKVDFNVLSTDGTCDGICTGPMGAYCDKLQAYFDLSVNQITRRSYSSNFPFIMRCYSNYFLDQIVVQPKGNVFLVPMATEATYNLISNPFEVVVETEFWDQDTWSGDDSFAHHKKKHGFSSWNNAINWFESECGNIYKNGTVYFTCSPDHVLYTMSYASNGTAQTWLSYRLSIYPNKLHMSPP